MGPEPNIMYRMVMFDSIGRREIRIGDLDIGKVLSVSVRENSETPENKK